MLLDTTVSFPLLAYILEHEKVKYSDLDRDLFYFGKNSLNHYIGILYQRGIVQTDYDSYTGRQNMKYKLRRNGRILKNEFIKISKEHEPEPKTFKDKLLERRLLAEMLHGGDYFEPLLALRCFDNEMPYKDFLKLGSMNRSYSRLSLKEKKIVDYRYNEDDVQTAYLNKEMGKMIDVIYGKEIIAEFKAENFGIDIQL
jgi:hypothetical protein